jgi:hypothetical protein
VHLLAPLAALLLVAPPAVALPVVALPVVAFPVAASAAAAPDPDGPRWTTVAAYDEVRVEVDAAHLGGAGALSAWVRWTFSERAASPTAWDLGVRSTVDVVEIDCAAFASRTLGSAAYAAGGAPVDAASFADEGAAWRRHRAGTVGGIVAAAVCRLAGRR